MAPPILTTQIEGTTKTLKVLADWKKRNEAAYRGAVYMMATNVMSTSLKLCPADTGFLRSSRFVDKPDTEGVTFTIACGYGAPYAIWVHEINKRYIVGEWKFLATALDYHLPTAARDMASWCAKLAAAGKGIDDVPETHPQVWTGGDRFGRGHTGDPKKKVDPKAKAKRARQRARDRAKNVQRIARESAASLAAQRSGARMPRPGR